MELNIAAQTGHLHARALLPPMHDNTIFARERILATELAIRFKCSNLALLAHVLIIVLVLKLNRAEDAFEGLHVEPRHHDVVDSVVEAFCFRAQRALQA